MKEIENINVNSRIKSLEFVSFRIEERQQSNAIDSNKITFEIGFNLHVDELQKQVTILNSIEIYSDESKIEKLASFQSKGEFIIENMAEVKQGNGIPSVVAATFIGVVVSSSRGMLRILSKGSAFEGAIIPILNPMSLLGSIDPSGK